MSLIFFESLGWGPYKIFWPARDLRNCSCELSLI